MESVKKYHIGDHGLTEGEAPGWSTVYLAADFERVAAEREALQLLLNDRDDLDDQLTSLEQRRYAEQQAREAAERRVEVLEAGIKWETERNTLLLESLTDTEDQLSLTSLEAGQRMEQLEGLLREASLELHDFITGQLLDRIEAALNPTAEATSDEQ